MLGNSLATRTEVGRVRRSFMEVILVENRVSISVNSFMSDSILVTLVSDVATKGTRDSFVSLGGLALVLACLVVIQ